MKIKNVRRPAVLLYGDLPIDELVAMGRTCIIREHGNAEHSVRAGHVIYVGVVLGRYREDGFDTPEAWLRARFHIGEETAASYLAIAALPIELVRGRMIDMTHLVFLASVWDWQQAEVAELLDGKNESTRKRVKKAQRSVAGYLRPLGWAGQGTPAPALIEKAGAYLRDVLSGKVPIFIRPKAPPRPSVRGKVAITEVGKAVAVLTELSERKAAGTKMQGAWTDDLWQGVGELVLAAAQVLGRDPAELISERRRGERGAGTLATGEIETKPSVPQGLGTKVGPIEAGPEEEEELDLGEDLDWEADEELDGEEEEEGDLDGDGQDEQGDELDDPDGEETGDPDGEEQGDLVLEGAMDPPAPVDPGPPFYQPIIEATMARLPEEQKVLLGELLGDLMRGADLGPIGPQLRSLWDFCEMEQQGVVREDFDEFIEGLLGPEYALRAEWALDFLLLGQPPDWRWLLYQMQFTPLTPELHVRVARLCEEIPAFDVPLIGEGPEAEAIRNIDVATIALQRMLPVIPDMDPYDQRVIRDAAFGLWEHLCEVLGEEVVMAKLASLKQSGP